MTVEEFRSLSGPQRRDYWGRLTVDERRELWGQLAAQTPRWGLDYPEDYNDPADTPTVMRALALDTDAALSTVFDAAAASDAVQRAYIDQQDAWIVQQYEAADQTLENNDIALANQILTRWQIKSSDPWIVGNGQIGVASFGPYDLQPGEEITQPLVFNIGTHFALCVQHLSTYISAVVQDLGNGTGYLKVRNGTTETPHTNIKVHVTFINP